MPVCSKCGVAWLVGERHVCYCEPVGVARQVPVHWSTRRALVVFGLLAGLVWAIVPWATWGALQSARSIPLVAIAGSVTGILLALLLGTLLRGRARWWSAVLGVCALPVGAFLFGWLLVIVDFLLGWAGLVRPLSPAVGFAPFRAGLGAVLSVFFLWPLTVLMAGFAVWTTRQVWALLAARGQAG